jgi:hypothetical protein
MWRNSIIAAHRRIVEARVPRNIQERRCSGWVTVLECDRVLKESPCNNQHNSAQINSLLEFVLVTLSLQEIFILAGDFYEKNRERFRVIRAA